MWLPVFIKVSYIYKEEGRVIYVTVLAKYT